MKILFFDTKDYEKEFFEKNLPTHIKREYFEKPLNSDFDSAYFKDTEGICCSITSKCSKENLSKFENLKYVFTRSTGFDHIDINYCKNNDIKALNVSHYGDWTVAEYTFALMLSAVRNIVQANQDLKTGHVNLPNYMGIELHSKTIGIIGLGQIGERVAKIAKGFNMKVLYYDIKQIEGYERTNLETLLKKSDFITINCPLNKNTEHLLSHKQFNMLKEGSVIINTARGEIINTQALICALDNNKISYVGLDVVECEYETTNYNNKDFCASCVKQNCLKNYMLNKKLLNHKNVLITPHIAYNTREAVLRILNGTLNNIEYSDKNNFEKIKDNCLT